MLSTAMLVACGSGGDAKSSGVITITYQVRGDVNDFPTLTYRTSTGVIEREAAQNATRRDLSEDVTVQMATGTDLSLTVKTTRGDSRISCAIVGSDGRVIAQNTSSGRNGTVTCTGRAE